MKGKELFNETIKIQRKVNIKQYKNKIKLKRKYIEI